MFFKIEGFVMFRKAILGLVVCLAGAGLSFGQDFPKPGPEHEKLKQLEGTWDAVMDFGGQKSKAKAVYKSICGGMWVQSDFEGEIGGAKFQGHGLDGYDSIKKKYVSVWVDSMSPTPLTLEGKFDPENKLLVMTGDGVEPDGKTHKIRDTTEFKDKDHMTFKMYVTPANGTEQLAFTIEYTRRK